MSTERESLFPADGKIVVAAPEDAVHLFDFGLDGIRVFTLPGLPEGMLYVVDLDEMQRMWHKDLYGVEFGAVS